MSKPYNSRHSWASQKHKKGSFSGLLKNISMFESFDKGKLFKNLVLLAVGVFFLGTIGLLGLFAFVSRDLPNPNAISEREIAQSTKIYDRTGEHLLYEIFGDENRTVINVQEGYCKDNPDLPTDPNGIPLRALQATIAAEDHNFCSHMGFSVTGLARAVIFGGSRGGGSTLTQQLVKNAILTNERTIIRKAKELILSVSLERRYTKDEILQIYFNEIPYGSTYYGIESASQNYYGKPSAELSVGEAATLAALPQLPTTYLNNPDRLHDRRNWIINEMYKLDFISEAERDEALATETPVNISLTEIDAPHYVLWVKELLEEEYGERQVEQGGLVVTTSLDYDKQLIAEEAVINNRDTRAEAHGFNNSGLVALDPSNGHILAMVGSTDYFDDEIDGQVNVTLRPLQPGSSMKPIVYAAGFERGYTPNSILWDAETTFPTATGPYEPKNYDLKEHGPVSIRKALQGSLNIPAVKMLYLVGVESGLDFAERLGYSTFTDRSDFGLAIVLGGAEVELLDHVSAYSVFATEGVYREPVAILKVEDPNGEVLQEWKEEDAEGTEVIDANIARMTSNVLSDDGARGYAFGTGGLLTVPGRPVAAKTGTTNNYKDAWTVGYTPQLVTGVWTGNTDGTQMNRGSGGSTVAAPVWNEFMRRALEGEPVVGFTAPNIPETGKSILDGDVPSETIVIDTASGKLATDRTPERFREEKTCGEYHTVLTYIDRFDPLGAEPSNPGKDPHYTAWEEGIQGFLVRENEKRAEEGSEEPALEVCEIPTEEDDVHVAANTPNVNIKKPKNNKNVDRNFRVDISANARRGVDRIEYLIDGSVVKVDRNTSGTNLALPSWVQKGNHTLIVNAYDDVDNVGTDRITINVTKAGETASFSITNPFNNQTIEKTGAPYNISLEASNANDYKSLSVRAQNLWTGQTIIISETNNPTTVMNISWSLPDQAEYLLSAQAVKNNSGTVDTSPIKVFVKDPPPLPESPDLTEG